MLGYITKAQAMAAGLTYEGTLYGVPAWFKTDGQNDVELATPKFVPLHAWCWLCERAYDVAEWLFPYHTFTAPIHVTGRIS